MNSTAWSTWAAKNGESSWQPQVVKYCFSLGNIEIFLIRIDKHLLSKTEKEN